jgi:hypothetical protein
MDEKPAGKISEHFEKVSDPRIENATRHKLIDIIVIAVCAVICGADGWSDVALYGRTKRKWLQEFLELPHGIPSHDTFGRIFAKLDPEEFEKSFLEWVQAVQEMTEGQVIAIDGKQLRGSHDRREGKSALYMVSAWATANHLVLGQIKVDEKSNDTPPRLVRPRVERQWSFARPDSPLPRPEDLLEVGWPLETSETHYWHYGGCSGCTWIIERDAWVYRGIQVLEERSGDVEQSRAVDLDYKS